MSRNPPYLHLPPLSRSGRETSDADVARRRLRWYLLGLVVLALFLVSVGVSGWVG